MNAKKTEHRIYSAWRSAHAPKPLSVATAQDGANTFIVTWQGAALNDNNKKAMLAHGLKFTSDAEDGDLRTAKVEAVGTKLLAELAAMANDGAIAPPELPTLTDDELAAMKQRVMDKINGAMVNAGAQEVDLPQPVVIEVAGIEDIPSIGFDKADKETRSAYRLYVHQEIAAGHDEVMGFDTWLESRMSIAPVPPTPQSPLDIANAQVVTLTRQLEESLKERGALAQQHGKLAELFRRQGDELEQTKRDRDIARHDVADLSEQLTLATGKIDVVTAERDHERALVKHLMLVNTTQNGMLREVVRDVEYGYICMDMTIEQDKVSAWEKLHKLLHPKNAPHWTIKFEAFNGRQWFARLERPAQSNVITFMDRIGATIEPGRAEQEQIAAVPTADALAQERIQRAIDEAERRTDWSAIPDFDSPPSPFAPVLPETVEVSA